MIQCNFTKRVEGESANALYVMDDDDDDDDGFPQVVGALSKGDRDVGGTLMDYYHTRGERERSCMTSSSTHQGF